MAIELCCLRTACQSLSLPFIFARLKNLCFNAMCFACLCFLLVLAITFTKVFGYLEHRRLTATIKFSD